MIITLHLLSLTTIVDNVDLYFDDGYTTGGLCEVDDVASAVKPAIFYKPIFANTLRLLQKHFPQLCFFTNWLFYNSYFRLGKLNLFALLDKALDDHKYDEYGIQAIIFYDQNCPQQRVTKCMQELYNEKAFFEHSLSLFRS